MKKRSLFSKILGLAAMLVGCILAVVAVDYYIIGQVQLNGKYHESQQLANAAFNFRMNFVASRDIALMDSVRRSIAQADTVIMQYKGSNEYTEVSKALAAYKAECEKLFAVVEKRGLDENSGIEGAFRKQAHALQSLADELKMQDVLIAVLMLRRNEKDFLLRNKSSDVEKFSKTFGQFTTAISSDKISAEVKSKFATLGNEYKTGFESIVATTNEAIEQEKVCVTAEDVTTATYRNSMDIIEQMEERVSLGKNIAVILIVAFGIAFAYFLAKNIARPVVKLYEGAQQVASGNFAVRIERTSNDDIGDLTDSFNTMTERIQIMQNEILNEKAAVERKVADGVRSAKEQSEYLSESISALLHEIEQFANGDLTVAISGENNDDISRLFTGFTDAVARINSALMQVVDAIDNVGNSSDSIQESVRQLVRMAAESGSNIEQVASAISEMSATIDDNARNIQGAREEAENAATTMKDSATSVAALDRSSSEIGDIILTISDIAEQTNLLALNAAIEAARAGDAGRGFAVVADEVRKLADRTHIATKEISGKITGIQKTTSTVVGLMKQVEVRARNVAADLTTLAAAQSELTAASEDLARNTEQIAGVTSSVTTEAHTIAESNEALNGQIHSVRSMVAQFRLSSSRNAPMAALHHGGREPKARKQLSA